MRRGWRGAALTEPRLHGDRVIALGEVKHPVHAIEVDAAAARWRQQMALQNLNCRGYLYVIF